MIRDVDDGSYSQDCDGPRARSLSADPDLYWFVGYNYTMVSAGACAPATGLCEGPTHDLVEK